MGVRKFIFGPYIFLKSVISYLEQLIMGMENKIVDGIKKLGFKELTEPQKKAIPIISKGKSALVIAPTGFGKTETALLPLFNWIMNEKPEPVSVLYITPLRALNRDLLDRMQFWNDFLGIKIAVRHGDTSTTERRKQMQNPPHILITTPETFQGLLTSAKRLLKNVKWVVVDEIHELLDNKRGYQLSVGLERLKQYTRFTRVGLSATVRDPKQAADFLRGSDDWPEIVDCKGIKRFELIVDLPKPKADDIAFAKENLMDPAFTARLRKIASIEGSVLVFSNTRSTAELLGASLNQIKSTVVHHSSLSKRTRLEAEQKFKSGEIRFLVATSSMELGIDVGTIGTVVQYGSPRQVIRLIQRVGRSGHSWDRIARGLVLVDDPEEVLESAVIARNIKGGNVETPHVEHNALDVLSHQIVGMLLQGIAVDDAYAIVRGAYPYRDLPRVDFDRVVDLARELGNITRMGRGSFTYYYSNLSTIPDSYNYDMVSMVDGHRIAVLDEEFISSLESGAVFICAGKSWQTVDVDPINRRVLVDQAKGAHSAPAWEGELIPVSEEIALEVVGLKRKLWELSKKSKQQSIDHFTSQYPVTQDAAETVVDWISKMEWVEPSIELFKGFVFIHAPLGSKANEALGKLLAGFFSLRTGASIGMRSDQYRIMLEFPSPTDGNFIRTVLNSINPQHIEANLVTIIRHSPVFRYKFIQVAKRFGIITRGAVLNSFSTKRLLVAFKGSVAEQETLSEIFTEKLDFNTLSNSVGTLVDLPVRTGPSPMAEAVLKRYAPELIGIAPEAEILRLLKNRLEKKRFNLKCLYCGKWEGSATPLTAPPKCPKCGAKTLGVVPRIENKKRLRKSADLYLTYGKKALLVMAGHGIGPDTAARILRRGHDEREILKLVLEAEKLYARTRRFWGV